MDLVVLHFEMLATILNISSVHGILPSRCQLLRPRSVEDTPQRARVQLASDSVAGTASVAQSVSRCAHPRKIRCVWPLAGRSR